MTRIRVFIKIPSDDAFELKAQALNNDPRLKEAGFAALKFVGDKKYLVDGNFSAELPPQETVEPFTEEDATNGGKLRVFVRIPNEDSYELKAEALNKNPLLKKAGISALRNVGDKQYIVDGEFTSTLPTSQEPEVESVKPVPETNERISVRMRLESDLAYQLIAEVLNGNPRLKEQGISDAKLVRQVVIPVSLPEPVKPRKKRWVLATAIALILIAVVAGGVVFAAPSLLNLVSPPQAVAPPPSVTASSVPKPSFTATIKSTSTKKPTLAPSTKTLTPIPPTDTSTPELVQACVFTASQQLFCRIGPSSVFEDTSGLLDGSSSPVVGYSISPIDNTSIWWQVSVDGRKCFVAAKFGTTNDQCDAVPEIPAPKTNSRIAGQVIENSTHNPLPGETVELHARNCSGDTGDVLLRMATDANGYYAFINLPARDYCVRVVTNRTKSPGGGQAGTYYELTDDENAVIDFFLSN